MPVTLALVPIIVVSLFLGSFAQASAYTCQSLFRDSALVSDRKLGVPSLEKGTGFVIPNENNIGAEISRFSRASEGIYVTVGTERSFMGAGLMGGKAKALVIADVDARVVLFNRVNKALLALSESRAAYLELRLRSSFESLQLALEAKQSKLSVEDVEALTSREVWSWWRSTIGDSPLWAEFHNSASAGFRGANYLFDDAVFNSISKLAKSDRIVVLKMDIASSEFRDRLHLISRGLNQKLSVVDLSNAWQEGYIGHAGTVKMLEGLREDMTGETRLVLTYQATDVSLAGHPTVFKFSFIVQKDIGAPSEIYGTLSNLERLDPSRRAHQNPRLNRYERFD